MIHRSFVAGDEDLKSALGRTRFAGSWGYSSADGTLHQRDRQITYGRPLKGQRESAQLILKPCLSVFAVGDILGCGLDRVTCRCFFTVNGSSQGQRACAALTWKLLITDRLSRYCATPHRQTSRDSPWNIPCCVAQFRRWYPPPQLRYLSVRIRSRRPP